MSKVGIIGDKDSIMGFLALGIDIFPAYTPEEIKKTIHSLQAGESLAKYKDFELPAIIVIPGIGGSMGLGMNEVRESAKRAIGADILFSE